MQVNIGGLFIPGLTLLFIYLKLTGAIAWTWFWVLSPLWIAASIAIIALVVITLIAAVQIGRLL